MKKKIMYIMSLAIMLLTITGCVKFNANMEIKKDKSMDFSVLYAFDSSYFGDQELMDTDNKKELEEKGFIVADYKEGNYKGFTISKKVKNIDQVSAEENIEYSISGIFDEEKNTPLFKVKKGFLKNTYFANFNFDTSDSDLNMDMNNDSNNEINSNWEWDTEESDSDTNDYSSTDITNNSDMDFSQISNSLSNMDLSFNIKLPYGANRSNATSTNNDNRELTWTLASNENENIEFEFEVYNLLNIILVAGGVIVLFIVLITIIIINKRKKTKEQIKQTEQVNHVNPSNPIVNQNNAVENTNNIVSSSIETPNANMSQMASVDNSMNVENQNPINLQTESLMGQPIVSNTSNNNINIDEKSNLDTQNISGSVNEINNNFDQLDVMSSQTNTNLPNSIDLEIQNPTANLQAISSTFQGSVGVGSLQDNLNNNQENIANIRNVETAGFNENNQNINIESTPLEINNQQQPIVQNVEEIVSSNEMDANVVNNNIQIQNPIKTEDIQSANVEIQNMNAVNNNQEISQVSNVENSVVNSNDNNV